MQEQTQDAAEKSTEPDTEAGKKRFFLGGRPQFKRQIGPALGAPRSILPQPYLPKGSVDIPAAPGEQAGELLAQDGTTEPANLQAEDGADQPPLTDNLGEAPIGQEAEDAVLTEGALETLDPSGVAVLQGGDGFADDLWMGRERGAVRAMLKAFAEPTRSPVMAKIARRLVLSGFTLAAPVMDNDVEAFVKTRLNVLAAHGDIQGYSALLSHLPIDFDWSGLAREIADGHLLAGRIEDACGIAAAERSDSNDPYWLRMAAFCRAVQGDRIGVDFQLGILEEVSQVQPTFYQLTDQILVEAEQAEGTILTNGMALSVPLKVDILEATMARLAKVSVPLLADDDIDPLAAKVMLSIPGVDAGQKLRLIGKGLEEGWVSTEALPRYMTAIPIAEDMALQALEFAETDQSFLNDVLLMGLAGQATDPDVKARAQAIVDTRLMDPDKAAYMLPVMAGRENEDAVMAIRSALLLGDQARAEQLFTGLRASPVGDDAAKDAALRIGWPLMTLAGASGAPQVTLLRLKAWWDMQAAYDNRFSRAALLFTLLEATGQSVPAEAWTWAEAGSVQLDGPTISPAHWRRMLMQAAEGDKAGVLSTAYQMTAAGTVSASFAGSLIGAMKDVGLEAEAHQLAAEIAVRRGL